MARVQELTERLAQLPDQAARESADELVSAVLELYGEGLERIFARDRRGRARRATALRERLQADGLVASLMLIHDLYPVPLEERVAEALESVRPYMESHGGNVELLEMKDGTARISLEGSCKTCPASTSTLELAIKQALDEAAPDLEALIVEGAESMQPMVSGSATELPVLQVAPGEAGVQPELVRRSTGAEHVVEGEVRAAEVAGVPLVVARVEGGLLAYRDALRRAATSPLHDGELQRGHADAAPSAPATTTCRARGARSTTTGSSSSRCRCWVAPRAPAWRWRHERRPAGAGDGRDALDRRAGARPSRRLSQACAAGRSRLDPAAGLQPPAAGRARSTATSAATRSRPTTATCCT